MNNSKPPYFQEAGTTRSFSMYPGLGPGGAPFGGQMYESQFPAVIPQQAPVPIQTGGGGGGGLGGLLGNLSNFKLTDIKSVVDRLGGIEGVMSTVGKMQKFMTTVKQMQPMIKLLINSFAKTSSDDDEPVKRRRKRRKRRRRTTTSKPLNKTLNKKKSSKR